MNRVIKKCLLIGINYANTKYELNGCINDTENMKRYLVKNKYFEDDDFIMMNDNQRGTNLYPTKNNILEQFGDLVKFAKNEIFKANIVYLFLAYSGHGTYLTDVNEDEIDGKDEALCPIDCDKNGYITDDVLKQYFIYKLPKNVKLTILIDACHSGTAMDLKYNYSINKIGTYSVHGLMPSTQCCIVMISGSRDDQTSSDAYLKDKLEGNHEYQGAMTASFFANYKHGMTYTDLISKMRKWLKQNGFSQVPQLSSGKYINIEQPFLLKLYK